MFLFQDSTFASHFLNIKGKMNEKIERWTICPPKPSSSYSGLHTCLLSYGLFDLICWAGRNNDQLALWALKLFPTHARYGSYFQQDLWITWSSHARCLTKLFEHSQLPVLFLKCVGWVWAVRWEIQFPHSAEAALALNARCMVCVCK